MSLRPPGPKGWYIPDTTALEPVSEAAAALQDLDRPVAVVLTNAGPALARSGQALLGTPEPPTGALPLLAWVPALTPDQLGDPSFLATYGTRVAYAAGAMANGIGSEALVIAMARGGMIGFFGAAGLSTARIEAAIDTIDAAVPGLPWGVNLIHSPQDPRQERATVELFLRRGVRNVSASAFMKLTTSVVQYRVSGLHVGPDGTVVAPNHLLAKISREEVARHFLSPAPADILQQLVEEGRITADEARLAAHVPMADDLTAEADSGGHTDNRPMTVLMPLICALRDELAPQVRVGAAGGIGSPEAAAAAFALGAAYVLTGSINQACVEAGTSPMVKDMLAIAGAADVTMAPAADMFEQGVQVQVLKRGTLFAMRGAKLYELYKAHDGLDAIPAEERAKLEKSVFRRPLDEVWADTAAFFAERDPAQLDRAARDPRHQMALVFRWYLGKATRWAIGGDEDRRMDAQIWCGPAIGAFNRWTAGTFLAEPAERRVAVVGANLMAGAAAHTRARWMLQQGVDPGPAARAYVPRPISQR